MQALIAASADAKAADTSAKTALHSASVSGFVNTVQVILEADADSEVVDGFAITALHQAAGSDAKATDQYAKTALHLACANGSVKIVQALLAVAADARQRISMHRQR